MRRVLLLGGTSDARLLAVALADAGVDTVYSYAGRTETPHPQPVPTRSGGFGGVAGLAAYLEAERISHVVDATHPFAAGMSWNAVAACDQTGTPLLALERESWRPQPGDTWLPAADIHAAVAALPAKPGRIFLAIGRQHVRLFGGRPEHFYLLRLVDPPRTLPLPLPDAAHVVSRGPFTVEADLALLREHGITHIVAKNAGGDSARAKLDAARRLGLPVIMIERPAVPQRRTAHSVAAVMGWITHGADRGV